MDSTSSNDHMIRAKELGRYSQGKEPSSGKPHEKSRILDAVYVMRMCAGCGKHMRKVKSNLVCSCKKTIYCSKDCLNTSQHKCKEPSFQKSAALLKAQEVIWACRRQTLADRKDNKGPSADKITRLLNLTRGEHRRIAKYAEASHPLACYVVGSAYAEREFDRSADYAIPVKYKAQSVAETNEMAVKWLKVAAEGGVPEAMFLLFTTMISEGGLRVDKRVAYDWLVRAHATGKMDYLVNLLEVPLFSNFASDLVIVYNQNIANFEVLRMQSLAGLLLATRCRELVAWDGKTAMGEPFFGRVIFKLIMKFFGELKNVQSKPFFIDGEKKKIVIISARPGSSDFADKCYAHRREENNLKFVQGVKDENSPDYQLLNQTSKVDGRTSYLISCKHDKANVYVEAEAKQVNRDQNKNVNMISVVSGKVEDFIKRYKPAGKCKSCVQDAKGRLRAVSLGQFSISLFPLLDANLYAARYSTEAGVIMQDVFVGYAKPYMRQMLQCLMSNPPDLHPMAVAEDANLFWPIIWFWGSVYEAVQDTCNKTTLDTIYHSLGQNIDFSMNKNASAVAAFPEAAAGEWRIACGRDGCPRVDHEVKFKVCAGCRVRRYCDVDCEEDYWPKHMQFCKANEKRK